MIDYLQRISSKKKFKEKSKMVITTKEYKMQINKREFLKTMGLLPIAPVAFMGSLDRLIEQPMPKNIIALKAIAKHILTVPDIHWHKPEPVKDYDENASYYIIGYSFNIKGSSALRGSALTQAFVLPESHVFIATLITNTPPSVMYGFKYLAIRISPSILDWEEMRCLFIEKLAGQFGVDYWAAEKMFLSGLNQKDTSEFILDHVADVEDQIKTFRKNGLTTRPIYWGTNSQIEYPIV